ncbi:hypothetical protein B566_EDAN013271 [Ephemera danica]|nr:hypothetical protein B566_EDAN013271 [Ephemera danica]
MAFENEFNWEGIEYPTSIQHVKFLKRTLKISASIAPKKDHYDLLILEGADFYHFTYIKNFSAVFRSQITKGKNATHVCKRCLTYHTTKAKLEKHH